MAKRLCVVCKVRTVRGRSSWFRDKQINVCPYCIDIINKWSKFCEENE